MNRDQLRYYFFYLSAIGSIIASIPALILALIHHDVALLGWLALVYLLINNFISNILLIPILKQNG